MIVAVGFHNRSSDLVHLSTAPSSLFPKVLRKEISDDLYRFHSS
jgi:hypothetical protein